MLNCSWFIKVLLAFEAFLLILSPKGVKALIGYEGVWFNPQFIFMFLILPLLTVCKAFDFTKFKKIEANIYLSYVFLICGLYFLATLTAISSTPVDVYYPLSESVRETLNFLLVFLPILYLRREYTSFLIKFIIVLGLFELSFVAYGLLGAFGYTPIPEFLKEVVSSQIYSQSWTALGFLPKWGGTFPETQLLSTFILMCYVFTDMVLKSKRVGIRILKLLFIVSIIYLQSKSAIIGLIIYLIFGSSSKVYRYIFSPIAVFGAVYFIYRAGSKEFASMLNFSSLESMALQYYSFSERIFHIVKSIEYMSHNIIHLLFGLGPRTYGTIVSMEYPGVFGPYSNAISIFNVMSDLGIIGFLVFTSFLIFLYKGIGISKHKIAYISVLISYALQVAWGESFIFMFLALLLGYDKIIRIRRYNK
jgi:hypothetical protein